MQSYAIVKTEPAQKKEQPVQKKEQPAQKKEQPASDKNVEVFCFDYALFDKRGEWYDHGNVQVATNWQEWSGTGDSPLGDKKEWNRLKAPEGVYLSDQSLPAQERAAFMNNVKREGANGFTYHIFANGPWHDRQWKNTHLDPGTYEVELWVHGDWATGGNYANKTSAGLEKRHALAELYINDDGKNAWLEMNLTGDNQLRKRFTVSQAGNYNVGWGIYTVWANGKGPNGCFIKGFVVRKV